MAWDCFKDALLVVPCVAVWLALTMLVVALVAIIYTVVFIVPVVGIVGGCLWVLHASGIL